MCHIFFDFIYSSTLFYQLRKYNFALSNKRKHGGIAQLGRASVYEAEGYLLFCLFIQAFILLFLYYNRIDADSFSEYFLIDLNKHILLDYQVKHTAVLIHQPDSMPIRKCMIRLLLLAVRIEKAIVQGNLFVSHPRELQMIGERQKSSSCLHL